MASLNQYGKETFQKFTYSLNPGDPLALSMSKQIEAVIRNALEPLQPEGQRIQRTQRTTDNNGRRNTDYYIKSEYASIARKAVDNFIQEKAAKRETNIDAHISDVSPSAFRTQTAAILDANVRAEIGRIVNQNGGFFSTDKNGLSRWGVEGSLQTEGSKGGPVNLSTSLARRVSSANRAHRQKWEDLMFTATGQRTGYNGFSQEERDAMAKAAKNKLQRNLYTPQEEKADTYARLAQAGRRYANERQYAVDNPDDPRVAAKRQQTGKRSAARRAIKIKKSVRSAASMARLTMQRLVYQILGLIIAGVFTASKTLSALLDVGETVRQRNVNDLKLNLAPGTNKNWVTFAKNNGFDEDALVKALGGLYGSFGNIRNFSATNLEPWVFLLGKDIVKTMSMFGGEGDENTVRMMNSIMDTLLRNAQSRIIDVTKSGGKITERQAISEQAQMLATLNPGLSSLYSAFLEQLDKFQKLYPNSGIAEFGGHLTGLAAEQGHSVTGVWDAFMTSGLYNPGEGGGTRQPDRVVFDTASMQALDNLRSAVASFRLIKEDVFAAISHNMVDLVNYVRSILVDFIRPFFPAFAHKEDERAAYINAQSREIVERQIGGDKQAAELLLKTLIPEEKVPGVIEALAYFKATKDVRPLLDQGLSADQMGAILSPGNFAVINAYLRDIEALKTLDDLAASGNKRGYMITDELSAETLKWNTGWILNLLSAAFGLYRNNDEDYMGSLNIAYSKDELEQKRRAEMQRVLSEGGPPLFIQGMFDKANTGIINEHIDFLAANRRRVAQEARGTFSPDKSTYVKTPLGSGPLKEFNYIAQLFDEVKKNPMLDKLGFQEGGVLKGLGEEAFNVLLQEGVLIANSELLASGNMAGKEQKAFYSKMRQIYESLRKTDKAKADRVKAEVLIPFLHVIAYGEAADEATRVALGKFRVDLPDILPDPVELFVEDILNVDSARTLLESSAERARLKALSSEIAVSADMSQLDSVAQKKVIERKISAIFGQSIYDLVGHGQDGKSVRMQSDAQSGDLIIINQIDGKEVNRRSISGVINTGQKIDTVIESALDFIKWQADRDPSNFNESAGRQ